MNCSQECLLYSQLRRNVLIRAVYLVHLTFSLSLSRTQTHTHTSHPRPRHTDTHTHTHTHTHLAERPHLRSIVENLFRPRMFPFLWLWYLRASVYASVCVCVYVSV